MSGIFGHGNGAPAAAITPDYTGLQIQTAVNALPIPIVWGVSKLAPNVIWYNNFIATPTGGGGGGGGKGGVFGGGGGSGGPTGYTYTADVIMALCEGPIGGVDKIWRGQSLYTLPNLGLSLALGGTPQATWSYLAAKYPTQALAYQGTDYVFAASYALTDAATLDNHNMEVQGFFFGTGVNGVDADPALVINDFLTNQQYGTVSPTGTPINVDLTTLFGTGGDASLQTYCAAVGLALSPALTDQETASSVLARWLNLINCAAVYSAGRLRFIPYGDSATAAGTISPTTLQISIPPLAASATLVQLIAAASAVPGYASLVAQLQAQYAAGAGGTTLAVIVTTPARFVSDGGVTYALTGTALTYIGPNAPTAAGTYGMGPPGTYLFNLGDAQAEVDVACSSSVAASYQPDVTPIYDLDDDDYIVEHDQDPLQISRTDPYEASNVWRLEIAERANAYNLTPIEARDQNAIELYGMRIASTVTAHEIGDPAVGAVAAQLMLQRAVYIRNTYKFRVSWEYCLLDPMDLVTVADSILGLDKTAIRITEIEEDDNGYLEITAEEFPLGVATATLYPTQSPSNNPINRNYQPAAVNTPIIFEPPSALAVGQVWIAASGGTGGAADPLWGGCNIWLSLDGTSYGKIGTIFSPARQGVLTASLASFSGTNPDGTDTLAVNLAESAGVLQSANDLAAQLGQTLCMVDSELLSFATATLTSANNYALTGLYRGLYGTTAAAHSSGAQFVRLDGSVFEYTLPAQYVGQKFYVKLQSFNVFGGGVQGLSTCTAYEFIPAGTTEHPEAAAMNTGTNQDLGNVTEALGVLDDFGANLALSVSISVDLGNSA